MIETQYQQARNNILAENVTLVFIVVSGLLHNSWKTVFLWTLCEVSSQIYRTIFMLRPYARVRPGIGGSHSDGAGGHRQRRGARTGL